MADEAAGGARFRQHMAALRRLSFPDRWVLVQSGLLITCIRVSLAVVSLRRLQALLRALAPSVHAPAVSREEGVARMVDTARLVAMAARHTPVANSCLHRSLALWWILRRRGFDTAIQFGARKKDGVFEAHAWIEHDGVVISDDQGAREFVPLPWTPLKHDA